MRRNHDDTAWLAAYALGLAVSGRQTAECAAELAAAATSPEQLELAHRRLISRSVGDQLHRTRAEQLLTTATRSFSVSA